MSDLLHRLQALGDAQHDDLSVAHDALEEIIALRARVAELASEITEQRRLRDYFGDRMARLDAAAREAMILLDQQEPRPEAAFATLLCALNPDLASAKRAALEGK